MKKLKREKEIVQEKNTKILENEIKIKTQLEDLLTSEEELRQNNEELNALVDNLENQKELTKESEKKYKAVLTNMDDIFYRTDINQNVILVSPSALQYTKFKTIKELISRFLLLQVHILFMIKKVIYQELKVFCEI